MPLDAAATSDRVTFLSRGLSLPALKERLAADAADLDADTVAARLAEFDAIHVPNA